VLAKRQYVFFTEHCKRDPASRADFSSASTNLRYLAAVFTALFAGWMLLVASGPSAAVGHPTGKAKPMSLHDLTVKTIDHKPQSLSEYRGKVLLVVNTASECGLTPQYEGLEKLYEAYKGKGLVVLGFPSNDFGGQEPGTEAEIKTFCSTKFHVTFPLFAKVQTKPGDGQSEIYKFLTAKNDAPKWNFHKFLVGKDGQVIRTFAHKVAPEDPELRAAIETALKTGN
jgi:glutathione peroxidase